MTGEMRQRAAARIAERLRTLMEEFDEDVRAFGVSRGMGVNFNEYEPRFKSLVREAYECAEALPGVDGGELARGQAAWRADLDEIAEKMHVEFGGGVIGSYAANSEKIAAYASRVEALIEIIDPSAINGTDAISRPGISLRAEERDAIVDNVHSRAS